MSYGTLDKLADAYVPLLALCVLTSIVAAIPQPREAFKRFCHVLWLIIVVYGLMFVDQTLHIWPKQGWDYSTHTAAAAACCWYLWHLKNNLKNSVKKNVKKKPSALNTFFQSKTVYLFWPVSLLVYLGLMRYQGYHTWVDMVTTILALLPLFIVPYVFKILR